MKLSKWVRDIFGINRYKVCWDCTGYSGHRMVGNSLDAYKHDYSKKTAYRIVKDMNKLYQAHSHWVEPV